MLLYCRCCACHLVVGDLNDAINFFVALLFDPQAPAFLLKKRKKAISLSQNFTPYISRTESPLEVP